MAGEHEGGQEAGENKGASGPVRRDAAFMNDLRDERRDVGGEGRRDYGNS